MIRYRFDMTISTRNNSKMADFPIVVSPLLVKTFRFPSFFDLSINLSRNEFLRDYREIVKNIFLSRGMRIQHSFVFGKNIAKSGRLNRINLNYSLLLVQYLNYSIGLLN